MSALRGDETALYREHADRLQRVVRTRVRGGDQALVEDACSFAWMQLLRYGPDRETVFPWLVQVATREAWRLVAEDRATGITGTSRADTGHPGVAADIEEQVAFRDLLNSVASLPQRRRQCLALLIAGHSYTEIARATGFSLTAVNKQLVKARSTLRQHGHDLA
ncbi:RNA polymerase sigma factor [Paraconexibacter algicola]|uniref:RNA polymerase sigma factor 70 region 4 type 2 domain-containing protein n=1 Tax=Paraconexibacter algicola TaxID=2133960 RepID=A0A2T4ULZ0_9ACTN|nr:sigma-70 family RNA polymerase sigma factor [Paraconexibacter algicola]PTL60262.1 hypothetical protein C7Y72_11745 [Paraconexibacter algicola]